MEQRAFSFLLIGPGPRPPFPAVAERLWGKGCDFDSDGNSSTAHARDWTELSIALRPECVERVDITPVSGYSRLVLRIVSDRKGLASRAAKFLANYCGGRLQEEPGAVVEVVRSPWPMPGNRVVVTSLTTTPPHDLDALLAVVRDEASFVAFIQALADDFAADREIAAQSPLRPYSPGPLGWENGVIDQMLAAAARWATSGARRKFTSENPWHVCALILYAGKIHE
jgi:hypothetical protein